MATYRFFKYKNEWRYREKTSVEASPIDAKGLAVLGVLGGPEVVVVRPVPGEPDYTYRITLKNGFITEALMAREIDGGTMTTDVGEFAVTDEY